MKILIVEDEQQVASLLARKLKQRGIVVDIAEDGNKGLMMAYSGSYDVILLDVLLPGIDGFTFCTTLRKKGLDTFIIILSARSMLNDKLTGLTTGADDYITKPFSFDELLARIYNLMHRRSKERIESLRVDGLTVDIETRMVQRMGKEITLTNREFQLLEYLMRRAGQVVSREDIINHVWDYEFDSFSNIVDVYMNYLRKKIDAPFAEKLVHTVKGAGYTIKQAHS